MALGTPTLTVTVNPAGYATLVLSCTGATLGSIRRITPDGSVPVRGAQNVDMNLGVFFTADYEIPQSTLLSYYAEVTNGTSTATTPVMSAPGLNRRCDWLAPFGSPLNGMEVHVEGLDDVTYESTADTVNPLNRRDPVVVSWGRHMGTTTWKFITLDDNERIQLMSMLNSGRTLMLQPRVGFGYEEPLYLAVGAVREKRPSSYGGEPARQWELEVSFTAPPPPQFVIALGDTWQDVLLDGHDWAYWAARATWLDLTGVI